MKTPSACIDINLACLQKVFRRRVFLMICLCLFGMRMENSVAGDPAQMAQVLGIVADWTLTPAEPVLAGDPPSLSSPTGLVVQSVGNIAEPSECLLSFRLKPAIGTTAQVVLTMAGGERPDKTAQSVATTVAFTKGGKYLNYTSRVAGVEPPLSGEFYLQAVTEVSLGWSDEMRRAIEQQIAETPSVEDSLLTLRCTVEKGRARIWLDGKFLGEVALPADMSASGFVKVNLSAEAELVSIRVRPLENTASERFEPLSIAGNLNAATLNGEKVDATSLPGGGSLGKWSVLDGVPFQFPGKSLRGDDHMDVGQSWTRFGALKGCFEADKGAFGGRWVSANRIDPARLAMFIPPGRYKALHLIAVSDDRENGVPEVSAQFYRPAAGHPMTFSGVVPKGKESAPGSKPVPIKLANGKNATLHHITIPLDPDSFSWFTDLGRIGLELTKKVQFYRAYPDPLESSHHGAGLPSAVQVYAMTLERAGVDVDIKPDHYGHVWTSPEKPGYSIELRNRTGAATPAKLVIETKSYDGQDTSRQEQEVTLPADGSPVQVPITLNPKRYGLQEMALTLTTSGETSTYRRNFAHLHPNTREQAVWEEGHGALFGYWGWGGGHVTPGASEEISVMGPAGAESSTQSLALSPDDRKILEKNPVALKQRQDIQALAEKYHYMQEAAFSGGPFYWSGFYPWYRNAPKWDPANPEASGQALVEALRPTMLPTTAISRPTYLPFFAEPQVGNITLATWPAYYGEDYKLSQAEQETFDDMQAKFLAGARAIRKEWPHLKLLLPYGDPTVAALFLRLSPEMRDLVDGVAMDLPGFERLPEQQINQVTFNRLYTVMKDIRQHKKDPYFVLVEGMHVPAMDIDTGAEEFADISMRDLLLFMGYGITRMESSNAPFDCANYWGENHYGGGWCNRVPLATPKLAYANYATMTRHLNRANFTKYLSTGSASTFCQQFQHYKTGKLLHVLWTIRGKRPVTVKVPAGTSLELYDGNDNVTTLQEKDGAITFNIDQSPQYLEGLTADAAITLGESDHSDSKPAEEYVKIADLGDGTWSLVAKEDLDYTKNKPLQIERFLGKMSAQSVEAPAEQGGKALAVHLEKQEKDRGVMPFYTTLEPKEPITIPGKASHLGLWVHAASDWGRVVYVVRDAKGEKWLSVGTKEEWNNDDTHCWSAFCFDGWRYLRFQMPSSAPYDSYREYGTTWWGSSGGDGIVDLPLKLEKVIVERRPKVIYATDLVEAKPDDVLLGQMNAEYASSSDKGEEAVRLSKVRMPLPKGAPELSNPIAELAKTGVGEPTKVLKVSDPTFQYDGTRCHVNFEPIAGAQKYDVWVSPYADGRGALQLGVGWTESGKLIEGLRPEIPFYAFVFYTDKDGKLSKPSAPFAFTLKDRFGNK